MDFRRLDLNLLLVFEALFDEGTVTAAARRLKLSQPTVSFSLAKLREYFGDELFLRTRTGMRPTPKAAHLREPVREAIDIIRHRILPLPDFVPAETRRTFSITTSDIGELCFLPLMLKALRERAPNASLRCVSLPPDQLEAAFEAGEVDLATGYFPDLRTSAFQHQDLFDHPFQCILRQGHPLAGGEIALADFLEAEHAVVLQKGRSQEVFEEAMTAMGLERRILLQSPHFMSLPFLIAQSDLVAIVPRAVATSFAPLAGLTVLQPPFEIPAIRLAQHWHRRFDHDPAVRWLRDLAAELFLDRDPTELA